MTTSALPPHDALPRMHLMATGDWSILLTATGCGRSQRRGLSVSRWRTDPLLAENGSVVLLRDAVYGAARSATRQPATASTPDDWRVTFAPVSACFERRKGALPSTLEIAPIATGDGEVRRVTLRNDGTEARTVDAISYVPLALGPMATDTDHPAYSKMFVQTAQADGGTTSLAWRRRSSPGDSEICAAHLCTPSDAAVEAIGFEIDRMAFIGCGHELGDADALATSEPPAGHAGTVLGPAFFAGAACHLGAGRKRGTGVLDAGRGHARRRAGARRSMPCAAAEMITAGVQAATERREQAQRTEADAARLQYLSAALFYPDLLLRAPPAQIAGGAPVLWAHGVSGDRSIVLARLGRSEQLALATQLDDAQRWWRQIGLDVDVTAVTAARGRGDADLAASLGAVKNAARESSGQFFVLRESDLTAVQRDGLAAAARIVLDDEGGDLAAQLRTRWDRSARCRLGPPIAAPRPMHRRTMPTGPADHSNSSMAWAALQMTAGSTS